jgi:Zn finger protein HypA/HybF involved in hydrogenase expression
MNKRIKKKKIKQQFTICDCCSCYTEYYREEDDGVYCPSCYADLVGISVSEVWACII